MLKGLSIRMFKGINIEKNLGIYKKLAAHAFQKEKKDSVPGFTEW